MPINSTGTIYNRIKRNDNNEDKTIKSSFYAKTDIGFGVNLQSVESTLSISSENSGEVHKSIWAFQLGLGCNSYYIVNNIFHPFIGIEANLRSPIGKTNLYRDAQVITTNRYTNYYTRNEYSYYYKYNYS